MKHLLATSALVVAMAASANADVILDPHLSGTGDNVTFQSFSGNTAVGAFNGQHTGIVDFTDFSGNPLFTGSANGNDIKIANTSDLFIQVFDSTGTTVLPTSTQVFSLKGDGNVTAFVGANDAMGNPEALQVFSLGALSLTAQSGFTFSTLNGEVMTSLQLLDVGCIACITDYEHYRIDVASVPGPIVGAGIPGLIAATLGLVGLARRRKRMS